MRRLCLLGQSLLLFATTAFSQAVISTHSGVLNYLEGSAFVNDQPVEQKAGSFPSIQEGSVLRTAAGRAEILLNPGVVLRIDGNSSIRMVSTDLSDTRVELLDGTVIVDSNNAAKTDGLVLKYKAYTVQFRERGLYRMSSEPAVFQAYAGVAEISGDGPVPTKVDETHQYFLDVGLRTEKYGDGTVDAFTEWARTRSETISADNAAAAESAGDPGDLPTDTYAGALGVDPGLGGGLPSYGGYASPMPGQLYAGTSPFLSLPPVGYPVISIWAIPVYGRWPRQPGYPAWWHSPRPILPGGGLKNPMRPYPAGTSAIVNGIRRYPSWAPPTRAAQIGVQPVRIHPVAPSVARPVGGIHTMAGHR